MSSSSSPRNRLNPLTGLCSGRIKIYFPLGLTVLHPPLGQADTSSLGAVPEFCFSTSPQCGFDHTIAKEAFL